MGCRLWGHTESDTTEATQWREMKKTKEMFPVGSFGVKDRGALRRLLEEGSKIKR